MVDVFKVADLLVSHAIASHGNDVDVIGYYGSYAKGVARDSSDFDIFYIPREGTNPPIARTFMVDEILFDFWAITWDTMEGFATGRNRGWARAPGIVHHSKLLHTRSDQQVARFAELKQQVLDLQKPEARAHMIRRALDAFSKVTAHLGALRFAAAGHSLADVRHVGFKTTLAVQECLALANQKFFDQGWHSNLDQLRELHHRPADIEPLIVTIATSSDQAQIVSACEQLASGTREVLRRLQASLPAEATVQECFGRSYPEIKDMILKVVASCERRQQVAASAAAWFLQNDLAMMLNSVQNGGGHGDFNLYGEIASVYGHAGLPDLMQCGSDDPDELAGLAKVLDERLREWLSRHSVALHEFNDVEELKRSL